MKYRNFFLFVMGVVLLPVFAIAQSPQTPSGEGMRVVVPKGWIQRHATSTPAQDEVYYGPSESNNNGIENYLLYQEFRGMGSLTAREALTQTLANAQNVCPNMGVGPIQAGKRNNYSAAFAALTCPSEPPQSKGRVSIILTIVGKESVYQIQRIWVTPKFEANSSPIMNTEIDGWVLFLSHLKVCDTRDSNHPCDSVDATSPFAPVQRPQ